MLRRTVSAVAVAFISTLLLVQEVGAQTALNRAVVESLRNQVQLLQDNRSARAARVSDVLVPGNGVSTAQQSFAELRFNDGSLGRLGERVVFWFTPGSREFRLSNGTALLLIPPGRGRTNVHTPNATAGIQGSALFVRYIAETDTTVVGALTDSGIEVINLDGSQQQVLRGGQMAVAMGDRITGVYEFDLRTFYETSHLVRGLAPEFDGDFSGQSQDGPGVDAGIAAVQEEMQSAIAQQSPLPIEGVMETPEFVRLPTNTTALTPAPTDPGELPIPAIEPPPIAAPSGEGQPFNEQPIERPRSPQPIVRPTRQPFQDRIEQAPVDPRLDEGNRLPNRPGQGNGQPIRDDRPGNDERPGNSGQPGNNERPGRGGTGNRPGNDSPDDRSGNGRPDNGNDRPGNGRPGNGNNQPGNGRPSNGNNRPGNGSDRPGNSNNQPGNGRPGNGNNRPGNGNNRPGNSGPGNGNNQPGNGNNRPGNGNNQPGNSNNRPGNGNDRPGNGNNQPGNDRPGNNNPGGGNGNNRPGNGNGNGGRNGRQ